MKTILAGLFVLALGGGIAFAQRLDAENVLVSLPQGYEIGYQASQGSQKIMEFIPNGETVEDWSAMITVQILQSLDDMPGDTFASNLAELMGGACEGMSTEKVTEGNENGFPFVVWLYACPLNPQTGKPETMFFKGITGSDAFYSIQYAFREEPNDRLISIAMPYLRKVSACDTRKPERPCPEGM